MKNSNQGRGKLGVIQSEIKRQLFLVVCLKVSLLSATHKHNSSNKRCIVRERGRTGIRGFKIGLLKARRISPRPGLQNVVCGKN